MINQATTLSTICLLIGLLSSCNNQVPPIAEEPSKKQVNKAMYKGLSGTWVRHNKYGFTLIEITDTANVLYYQCTDRWERVHDTEIDRYWYYKSNATMGYRGNDSTDIWISTRKFRFDYRIEANGNMTEYDKMGDQGIFVKMQEPE